MSSQFGAVISSLHYHYEIQTSRERPDAQALYGQAQPRIQECSSCSRSDSNLRSSGSEVSFSFAHHTLKSKDQMRRRDTIILML
jgi:hypothetical protein